MRLSNLIIDVSRVIFEGYGVTWNFDYDRWKQDPQPQVLKLGTWVHPSTGNTLIGGVNLNYMTPNQIDRLRYYLPDILKNKNLKDRYWAGMGLAPDIFKQLYRTYDRRYINIVTPSTLKFMTPAELQKLGQQDRASRLQTRRDMLKDLAKKKDKTVPPPEPEDVPQAPKPEAPPEAPEGPPETPPTPSAPPRPPKPGVPPEAAPGLPGATSGATTPGLAPEIAPGAEPLPEPSPLKSKKNTEVQAKKAAEKLLAKKLEARIDQRTGKPLPKKATRPGAEKPKPTKPAKPLEPTEPEPEAPEVPEAPEAPEVPPVEPEPEEPLL